MALTQAYRDDASSPDWAMLWFHAEHAARLIVDAGLSIHALNDRAKRILAESRSLSERDGRIVSKDRAVEADLRSRIGRLEDGVARSHIIASDSGGEILVRAQHLGSHPRPLAGLWLRDLRERIEVDCADLEPLFGLTRAEQAILVQLLRGMSSQEIARSLSKSVLTVRTHIKRIYLKLHVTNREQMFARTLPFIFIL